MRRANRRLSPAERAYKELKKALDNERIADLLLLISFYCGVVQSLGVLKIDVEEDHEKYLKEFLLYG